VEVDKRQLRYEHAEEREDVRAVKDPGVAKVERVREAWLSEDLPEPAEVPQVDSGKPGSFSRHREIPRSSGSFRSRRTAAKASFQGGSQRTPRTAGMQ
jgi:hypothetical protein